VTEESRDNRELRVLLLTPTAKDAALTASVLEEARMECVSCSSIAHVRRELEVGAGVVLLPEEAVLPERDEPLVEWLRGQPPWSDLPVLVLARPGADSAAVAQAMDLLGNVTVLERPMRVAALVSAVRTALRARQRQYQIREHLAEHEQAERALRDSDRRKDEFLAILAHELRNPLAPIRNALQILRLTQPHDAAEHVAEIMDRQVGLMVRLVDDLLEVSRISSGKIDLRRSPVDVAAVVHSAIETSRPLIEAGGHRLVLEIPGAPLTLEGDFVRLTQVVANLLNNAAKYSDPGGEIRVCVGRDDDGVTLSVRDQGKGIPPEMLPRVFELFVQLDRDNPWAQGGLGIGLTLAKTLVELHGGTVEARSEGVGSGSEFIVRLPSGSTRAATRAVAEDAQPAAALASQRILVVDDNRDAAESLATLLSLLGADVHVAFSGPEALDAFAAFGPSVVLLDIGMPGMDGHEVARRLRSLPGAEDVTLIALTGWGQAEDRQRSRSAGFDHHIVKPADIHALQSLLVSLDA
jgi:signal transduction histidine kinase